MQNFSYTFYKAKYNSFFVQTFLSNKTKYSTRAYPRPFLNCHNLFPRIFVIFSNVAVYGSSSEMTLIAAV